MNTQTQNNTETTSIIFLLLQKQLNGFFFVHNSPGNGRPVDRAVYFIKKERCFPGNTNDGSVCRVFLCLSFPQGSLSLLGQMGETQANEHIRNLIVIDIFAVKDKCLKRKREKSKAQTHTQRI